MDLLLRQNDQSGRGRLKNFVNYFVSTSLQKGELRTGMGGLASLPAQFFSLPAHFGTPYANKAGEDLELCNETKGGFYYESG